ncbi:MAG: DUF2752 domain-containing protein [Planctomycetota bacterium]|nr:DUF2752 domain-containing protein [Planctomycetota bacterium]
MALGRIDRLSHVGIPLSFLVMVAYPLLDRAYGGGTWPRLPCVFKSWTGLPCPTCGYTRSVQQIVDGNLLESLRFHPLGLGLLIFYGFLSARCVVGLLKNRPYVLPGRAAVCLAALLLLAWIGKLCWMEEYW